MSELQAFELIVSIMIVANCIAFGVLFGRTAYLSHECDMWFHRWIDAETGKWKERKDADD